MAALPDDLESSSYDAACDHTLPGSYGVNVSLVNNTYHVTCEVSDGTNATFGIKVHGEKQDVARNETSSGNADSDGGGGEHGDGDHDDGEGGEFDNWDGDPNSVFVGSRGAPGWNKVLWNEGDWATWIALGPVATIVFCSFVLYSFGAVAALACATVCLATDTLTYYYNW